MNAYLISTKGTIRLDQINFFFCVLLLQLVIAVLILFILILPLQHTSDLGSG